MKKERKQEEWLDHFEYYFNKYLVASGIKVYEISFKKVPKTKLYRMKVVADFGDMLYYESKGFIDKILRDKFPYDEHLRFCKIEIVGKEI